MKVIKRSELEHIIEIHSLIKRIQTVSPYSRSDVIKLIERVSEHLIVHSITHGVSLEKTIVDYFGKKE